jgi:hypothetical protein
MHSVYLRNFLEQEKLCPFCTATPKFFYITDFYAKYKMASQKRKSVAATMEPQSAFALLYVLFKGYYVLLVLQCLYVRVHKYTNKIIFGAYKMCNCSK